MRKAGLVVLLTVVVTATALGQTTTEGEIAGSITDIQAAALPGVRVTITSSDERREAITDSHGQFVLRMLKLGTYRVAADLAGFVSESGTITLSATTRRAHIAWSLKVGCISEDIRVILSARETAPMVAALVHIRVRSIGVTRDSSEAWRGVLGPALAGLARGRRFGLSDRGGPSFVARWGCSERNAG